MHIRNIDFEFVSTILKLGTVPTVWYCLSFLHFILLLVCWSNRRDCDIITCISDDVSSSFSRYLSNQSSVLINILILAEFLSLICSFFY